jgi:hypothetical protein
MGLERIRKTVDIVSFNKTKAITVLLWKASLT